MGEGTGTTSYSPRDGRAHGTVPDTTTEELRSALARAAAVAERVGRCAPDERRRWLHAVADRIQAHSSELVDLAEQETGLGLPRLEGELARAASQLRFYGEVAAEGSYLGLTLDHSEQAVGTGPSAPVLVRINQPLGPVAVFGASNFPFAFGVLGNDTASAIAAGCPVLVKAHPAHPRLSSRLVELAVDGLVRAQAPEGTLALVHGLAAGSALVQDPAVTAVGFTGSQAGGLALWRLANERPVVIPVYAEMSTVNPVVMTSAARARRQEIAEGFVGSFTLGSGQFCTKPGLLLAPAGAEMAEAVGQALLAAAPSPVMLTEQIAASASQTVRAWQEAGATVVARVESTGPGWHTDAIVLRAPGEALSPGSPLRQECFGPVALVVEYADSDELARLLTSLQGSLAGSVMTAGGAADPDAARWVALLAAQTGRVTVDEWPTGVAWTWAQHHGGPWPATTAPAATSVGAAALGRWVRPVTYQSVPQEWLPVAAGPADPWHLPRRVDGILRPSRVAPQS